MLYPQVYLRNAGDAVHKKCPGTRAPGHLNSTSDQTSCYSMMVETRPEPTVWPPSRIAKRRPSSMAMG